VVGAAFVGAGDTGLDGGAGEAAGAGTSGAGALFAEVGGGVG